MICALGPPVPAPSYGPIPAPSYGPPPNYAPPIHHDHVIYTPHKHSESILTAIWGKIAKKFDLLLVSKILLKLIIFKKIIKFITILCLLMFIPQLMKATMGTSNDDDEHRNLDAYGEWLQFSGRLWKLMSFFSPGYVDQKVKEVFNFAVTAIEGIQNSYS